MARRKDLCPEFGKTLEESIQNDCQSKFKHMLTLICKAERNEGIVSLDKVRNDAEVSRNVLFCLYLNF
ncbi:hypothetical protein TNCV_2803891 [Trichonephila clavipes]|nr:hypothetical protein TNCV_2803891 [Trichonephila clavipes]